MKEKMILLLLVVLLIPSVFSMTEEICIRLYPTPDNYEMFLSCIEFFNGLEETRVINETIIINQTFIINQTKTVNNTIVQNHTQYVQNETFIKNSLKELREEIVDYVSLNFLEKNDFSDYKEEVEKNRKSTFFSDPDELLSTILLAQLGLAETADSSEKSVVELSFNISEYAKKDYVENNFLKKNEFYNFQSRFFSQEIESNNSFLLYVGLIGGFAVLGFALYNKKKKEGTLNKSVFDNTADLPEYKSTPSKQEEQQSQQLL